MKTITKVFLFCICQMLFSSSLWSQTCPGTVSACDPATGSSTSTIFYPIDMSTAVQQPDPTLGDFIGPEVHISNAGCDGSGNLIDVVVQVEQLTTTTSEVYLWNTGEDSLYFKGGANAWYEFTISFFEAGTTTPISLNVIQEIIDIDGDCDINNDGVYDIADCTVLPMEPKNGDYVNVTGYDWYFVGDPTLIYESPFNTGDFVSAGYNNGGGWSAVSGVSGADIANLSVGFAWLNRSSITYKFWTGDFKGTYLDLTGDFTFENECFLLPVSFNNFSATKKGNDVLVEWSTGSETNGMQFDLEYSTDGINFTTLSTESSKGSADLGHSYSFLHQGAAQLNSPTIYYRVKFLEYGGSMSMTAIKSVDLHESLANNQIGYNALEKALLIRGEGLQEAQIFDINGRLLKQQNLDKNSSLNVLDVSDLSNGVFIARAGNTTTKIIIQ